MLDGCFAQLESVIHVWEVREKEYTLVKKQLVELHQQLQHQETSQSAVCTRFAGEPKYVHEIW